MKKNRLIYGNVFSPGHHAPEAFVVCGKRFVSKKALGGHMNQHPERPWRGLYPPSTGEPTATRNGNTTAPLLIDLNQPTGEPAAARNGNTTAPLLIDLNQPAPEE